MCLEWQVFFCNFAAESEITPVGGQIWLLATTEKNAKIASRNPSMVCGLFGAATF